MDLRSDGFHLSVVVTSRNDDHGGSLLYRMHHFLHHFVAQCRKWDLSAELIIVEWNPPEDRPPLSEVLSLPEERGPCTLKILQVSKAVHEQFEHGDKLPLFQMIAKNVGIRRAQGRFVLATNIDILFSDAVILFMKNHLEPGRLYRADRLDVPHRLPEGEPILDFCERSFFRINSRWGIKSIYRKEVEASRRDTPLECLKRGIRRLKNLYTGRYLHTNACGDFTLMAKEDWFALQGYPEWMIYSFHIDSVLLYQARELGLIEVDLPRFMPIYHIEHGPGSGYSLEGAHLLFGRLKNAGIPYLSDGDLCRIITKIRKKMDWRSFYPLRNPDFSQWGLSEEL